MVESVESREPGFDLISRRPHPEDPKTFDRGPVHRGEGPRRRRRDRADRERVQDGRAAQGETTGSTWSSTAAASPSSITIQDPARLGWEPVVQVEHYQIDPGKILAAGAGAISREAEARWSLTPCRSTAGQEVRFLSPSHPSESPEGAMSC